MKIDDVDGKFYMRERGDKESRCSAGKPWIYAAILYLGFTKRHRAYLIST